mmetsp:Transcript_16648/g.44735  ORF Transcript_16648/g.44735 Transcript_16648/m.44735 type:complete len:96 (+) Transcript_16648:2100-2387(+)
MEPLAGSISALVGSVIHLYLYIGRNKLGRPKSQRWPTQNKFTWRHSTVKESAMIQSHPLRWKSQIWKQIMTSATNQKAKYEACQDSSGIHSKFIP